MNYTVDSLDHGSSLVESRVSVYERLIRPRRVHPLTSQDRLDNLTIEMGGGIKHVIQSGREVTYMFIGPHSVMTDVTEQGRSAH